MNGYGSVPTSRPVPQTPYAMGSYGMMYAPPTSSGLANNAYHLYEQAQVSQAETMSTTGSDHSTHSSYNCNPTTSRFQNLRTSSFAPTGTAHQPVYPGTHVHHYDTSPETSSHSDSAEHHYADPQYQPVNQPLVSQWTATADQASQLKDELSRKQQRINELQHEVEAADLHRRQVQTRNFELEAMLQGHSGHQVAVDTTHMHALTAENAVLSAGLQARIVQLTQQLSQGSGLARSHNLELQQKVLSLNATVSQLMSQLYTAQRAAQAPPQQAQHESQHTQRDAEVESQIQLREAQLEQEFKDMVGQMESEHEQRLLELKTQHGTEVDELQKQLDDSEDSKIKLRQEHDQQLDVLRDDHADQLLDVKTDHANLMDQLTKQKEKVEATLSESQSTSKEAADKHSVVVQQLTDQIQQLEASLNTARSQSTAVQQQQPELKLLQQQKQRLENDLKEAHNANRVVENKLEEADLQLADAEDKLSEAEQKLKQAEKQASKAAKTIRV